LEEQEAEEAGDEVGPLREENKEELASQGPQDMLSQATSKRS